MRTKMRTGKYNRMEREPELPSSILALLYEQGLEKKDVLYFAEADLSPQGEYARGFLVWTQDFLFVFGADTAPGQVHYYKGYREAPGGSRQEEPGKWHWEGLPLADLERIWMENGVGCNVLVAKTSEGERTLAMFTHLHKRRMARLLGGIEQLKRGETPELSEEATECCPKCGRMYPDDRRKICPNCMDRRNVFFRVLAYFKPYRVRFALLFLATVFTALLNLVWPYLNGTILYDKILAQDVGFLEQLPLGEGGFVTALFLLVLTMVMTKLMLLLLQIVQGILTAQMVVGVVRDMKKDVFRIMGELSISFYRSRQTGGLMTRVMSDADRITGFFVDGAPYLLVHGFTMLASFLVMFSINPLMALVTIFMFPVLVAVNVYLRPKIWVMFGRRHRAERSLNSSVNDNLTGARVVKSFGQERRETERFGVHNKKLRDAEIAITYRQNYFHFVYGAAQSIATMGAWAIGVYLILGERAQSIDLGVLLTFVGYVGQLEGPMGFLPMCINGGRTA
ncbi:MAG: ABC transporter transmembrane domain-containing protein [Roseburia sp.]|nr:ABC transporter transmembrane domain-containing protein [Roseburia sp.]